MTLAVLRIPLSADISLVVPVYHMQEVGRQPKVV
jgi:hypothetical protein